MKEYIGYIPHAHTLLWLYIGGIVTWKISPFLRAMREACSEKSMDGSRGKVSIKRIIPLIFTGVIGYMVIGNMHTGKPFNESAFWGIMGYIGLATTVITVSQIDGIMDRVSTLKGKMVQSETKKEIEITST